MYSVTYQPRVDDYLSVHAEVGSQTINPWRLAITTTISYAVILGSIVFVLARAADTFAIVVFCLILGLSFVWSLYKIIFRIPSIVRARLEKVLATKKNIGMSVPTTISLFPGYVESASRLGRLQWAWDQVEEIVEVDGYIQIHAGISCLFVPRQAFLETADADLFLEAARAYHHDALSRPTHLTDQPPWECAS